METCEQALYVVCDLRFCQRKKDDDGNNSKNNNNDYAWTGNRSGSRSSSGRPFRNKKDSSSSFARFSFLFPPSSRSLIVVSE